MQGLLTNQSLLDGYGNGTLGPDQTNMVNTMLIELTTPYTEWNPQNGSITMDDIFDAMVSGLPHPGLLDVEAVAKEIAADSGRRFDPQVVSVFLRTLRRGKLLVA